MVNEVQSESKPSQLRKIFHDIFLSPADAFDSFLNNKSLKIIDLLLFHFALWLYAPFFKLVHNLISYYILLPDVIDKKIYFKTGLLTSFLTYPILFILILFLDAVRKQYLIYFHDNSEEFKGVWIAGIPMSASVLFWTFPKPFNAIFITIAFLFSLRVYYISLISLNNLTKLDFYKILIYYGIILGSFSALAIFIGNTIRSGL